MFVIVVTITIIQPVSYARRGHSSKKPHADCHWETGNEQSQMSCLRLGENSVGCDNIAELEAQAASMGQRVGLRRAEPLGQDHRWQAAAQRFPGQAVRHVKQNLCNKIKKPAGGAVEHLAGPQ